MFPSIRQDRAKAVEILVKDLKVFASFNEELFKEITQLLTLDNFRYCLFSSVASLLIWRYAWNWPSYILSICIKSSGKTSSFPSMETQNRLGILCL